MPGGSHGPDGRLAAVPPLRPTRHRLHLAPALDDLGVYDLGVYSWPHPLDVGDTLTLADGRR
jgi:hypothetical protein